MKLAVTGASGYVGRHVAAALERRGIRATLAARRKPESAFHHAVALDIGTADDPLGALGAPDVVLHLAWGGLPNYKSAYHADEELPRQRRFLERLVQGGPVHLVVAGTCLEYGMQSGALREDLPASPVTAYGTAKDSLRRHLLKMQTQERRTFTLSWARLFYSWGAWQSPASLYPLLLAAAARGDATFPMSGGQQVRDYLPAERQAEHLVALALAGREVGVVNVCSGRPITVRAIVEEWIAANGWSIRPELGVYPYPDYEPMSFWGDRTKLDRVLSQSRGLTSAVRNP